MKRRIQSILPVLLLFSFSGVLMGAEETFDFGGQVRTLLGWEGPGDGMLLEGEPSLWFQATLSSSVSLELRARLLSTLDTPRLFDLEKAVFQVQVPRYPELDSSFSFKVGRQEISDFSTYVFDHRVDGAIFRWMFPFTEIQLAGGYTGWQPREVSCIYLTSSDVLDSEDTSLTYGPRRMVEIATFLFPHLLLSQDLILSVLSQQDLRTREPDSSASGEDRIHTNYLGLGSKGRLYRNVLLSLFGYLSLGFGGVDYRLFSGIYGVSVLWKGRSREGIELEGMFLSASGDDRLDSIYDHTTVTESSLFLPVSQKDTGVAFSPLLANVSLLQFRGGFFPVPKLWVEGRMFFFFRTTAGPISESGLDPSDSTDLFLGPEWDLELAFQPYSDLKIRSSLGLFLPASGSMGAFSPRNPWVKSTVEIVLSF
ncbi:MAG: hypothetical protein Kow009_09500 [Spirochaetales bacterium]